ncbi:IS1634 family transposase [Heliophilum fasciatum]|uniref:Transposase n=1 Tax=Heliophilum fasciatum TaxID=35700 RepID=A0A4R2RX67_9FIRM|nr:IS1634 family transposase [Heliophilum fasciatum]MCW2278376.1 transposase [Heliophilum fasciatum]TCP63725.1 transposase [Heliophilum fasciatum]
MSRILHGICSKQLGPSALIAGFTRELALHSIINRHVRWDPDQWKRSPGLLVEAMMVNMLTSRTPLYRVETFFESMDTEALFGPGVCTEDFNDDAIGRMLDRLHEVNLDHLYCSVVLAAWEKHQFDRSAFHGDTTRILLTGEYSGAMEDPLKITYGYNAQGIRGAKQFSVGAVVNREGIPIMGSIHDGNQSDNTWNTELLAHYPAMITALGQSDAVYIADSKLVTPKNLRKMRKKGIRFISRFPNTYQLTKDLIVWAEKNATWSEPVAWSTRKGASIYRTQEITARFMNHRYRFVIVRPSQLDERQVKRLEKEAQAEKHQLEQACHALAKRTFACETDAQEECRLFARKHRGRFYSVHLTVASETKVLRKPGRPKAGVVYPTETVYRVDAAVSSRDVAAWEKACHQASSFVLITSLKQRKVHDAHEVLRLYKEQNAVEMRFRFLKNPTMFDGVFLKKPESIKALGYLFLLALLIFSLLELRVRRAVAERNRPLHLRYRKNIEKPTGLLILDTLKTLTVIYIQETPGRWIRYLPDDVDSIRSARISWI